METDVAFLQELADALKEKGIPVIDDIRTDTSAQFVFMKLADRLRAHFQMRTDFIERHQAQKLTPKELSNYELRSYIYQQSKFGRNSPIAPANPCKSREYAVLYRERIYYLSDEEEQKAFLVEPSKYTKGVEPVPLDLLIKPRALVLGLPKCGKSTLCQRVAQ
jgi:adenylate/nucleoside-diphosphate kinase